MKSKIGRISIFILVLIIIGCGVIFLFRGQIKRHFIPTVKQTGDIKIIIKNDTSYISTRLAVINKSFLKIGIDTLKYKVSLFGKLYLQDHKFIGMVLHGHAKDTIDFSVKVPYAAILKDLKTERQKSDSATYSINIFLQYSTALGKREMPINKSAKLKIPQPPELKVMEIKYKKVRLKSILANAKIRITNNSAVKLSIKSISYAMDIVKAGNLKGDYKKSVEISPHGTTFIDLPLEINVDNIGKTIFQVIMNKDNYDYTLKLNAYVESTDPIQESFHIDLTKDGKMELKK